MNNKIKKKSPLQFGWVTAALAVAGYLSQKKAERRARGEMREAQAKHEKRMQDFENLEFQPIDPNIVDQENIFEELMEACKCCSLGEITKALFDVGGQYRRNM